MTMHPFRRGGTSLPPDFINQIAAEMSKMLVDASKAYCDQHPEHIEVVASFITFVLEREK